MSAKGTQETVRSSDWSPESGHQDSASWKRPLTEGRSVPQD